MTTIAVCIPCIEKHIPFLFNCIDSIHNQSALPDEIIISISNINNRHIEAVKKAVENKLNKYRSKIKIIVSYTSEKKYAGQNRNTCIELSSSDIISLFDADDVMQKDRIRIIKEVFRSRPDAVGVLHYFVENKVLDDDEEFSEDFLKKYNFDKLIHFGHASFRRKIFDEFKYSDMPRGQDVQFIASLLPKYLNNLYTYTRPLTYYFSTNSSYWNKNLSFSLSDILNKII